LTMKVRHAQCYNIVSSEWQLRGPVKRRHGNLHVCAQHVSHCSSCSTTGHLMLSVYVSNWLPGELLSSRAQSQCFTNASSYHTLFSELVLRKRLLLSWQLVGGSSSHENVQDVTAVFRMNSDGTYDLIKTVLHPVCQGLRARDVTHLDPYPNFQCQSQVLLRPTFSSRLFWTHLKARAEGSGSESNYHLQGMQGQSQVSQFMCNWAAGGCTASAVVPVAQQG
jgi:hypothetical protein